MDQKTKQLEKVVKASHTHQTTAGERAHALLNRRLGQSILNGDGGGDDGGKGAVSSYRDMLRTADKTAHVGYTDSSERYSLRKVSSPGRKVRKSGPGPGFDFCFANLVSFGIIFILRNGFSSKLSAVQIIHPIQVPASKSPPKDSKNDPDKEITRAALKKTQQRVARIIQSYRADTGLQAELDMLKKLVSAKERTLIGLEQQRVRMVAQHERVGLE